jgi:single-strand DNA-binding protein
MLNHVILVGRLVRDPELQLTESGKKRSSITLAVSRGYKNPNGEYETDFLDCVLWTGIAENTSEYCKSGDLIGIKGRLQTWLLENDDGSKYKKVEVVAEKVTFLSSARNNKLDENDNGDFVDVNNDGENINNTEISVVKESEKKYNKKKK